MIRIQFDYWVWIWTLIWEPNEFWLLSGKMVRKKSR